MKNNLGILIFILFNVIKIYSQTITDNPLESKIDSIIQNAAVPFMNNSSRVGLSIGIYNNDEIYSYNYGSTEKLKQNLPTNKTIYEIGSISKTITGVILAHAVIDKKVKIDDDIRNYLAQDYPNLEYKGHPIKLFQLLNHSSCLPFNIWEKPELVKNAQSDSLPFILSNIERNYTKEQFLKDLHKVKIDTIPGIKLNYSNSAAQLLSFILENVYKTSFEHLILKFISQPLEMQDTKITFSKAEQERFAKGYNENGDLMPYNSSGAAGGIYSTVTDMIKYIKFQLNENNPVVKLSHKPTWGNIDYYAMGLNWQMDKKANGHRRIFQSGGTAGFNSYIIIYPYYNMGIILLANESDKNSQGGLSEIASGIFKALH
jgi:serine-type D-Ala-D-Ala carboxypeptidase/endopeptidase